MKLNYECVWRWDFANIEFSRRPYLDIPIGVILSFSRVKTNPDRSNLNVIGLKTLFLFCLFVLIEVVSNRK